MPVGIVRFPVLVLVLVCLPVYPLPFVFIAIVCYLIFTCIARLLFWVLQDCCPSASSCRPLPGIWFWLLPCLRHHCLLCLIIGLPDFSLLIINILVSEHLWSSVLFRLKAVFSTCRSLCNVGPTEKGEAFHRNLTNLFIFFNWPQVIHFYIRGNHVTTVLLRQWYIHILLKLVRCMKLTPDVVAITTSSEKLKETCTRVKLDIFVFSPFSLCYLNPMLRPIKTQWMSFWTSYSDLHSHNIFKPS